MLFSRSGGCEFKPPRDHMFKDFGNLYTGVVTPQRTCSKETELASGCMDVDVKGSIMSSGGASSRYL